MAGLQGRVFGGYRLAEQMAGGGIAEVYRAQAANAGGREVVVKIIYPEFARQPGFQSNFRNIVQMAAKLVNHPHILPVIANGEEGGYLYLVTPYVAQGTLRDWLQSGHRLGPTDVGPFFRQLCGALAYAHSLGILHSNLKLSNVFLFEGRHVLVADFGLLWDITHLDMNHTGSGTDAVEFLAPEGFSGRFTQQSDIYALGAMLFATLTGFPPFQGRKPADLYSAHTQHPVPRLAQAAPQIAPGLQGLDSVIQRAMAKSPEDRFPSAMALSQAIEAALRQPMPAMPGQMGMGPRPAPAPAAPVHYPAVQPALPPPGAPFPGAPGAPQPGLGAVAPLASAAAAPMGSFNPPFQPLNGGLQVDEKMEQGREWHTLAHAAIPRQQRPPAPSVAPAPANDSEVLRTAVVPKPVLPPNPGPGPMQPSVPPAEWGNGAPSRGSSFDPSEDMGPLKLPAIRPQGPAGSGNNGSPSAEAFAPFPEDSPLGDDRFDGGTNFHRALAVRDERPRNWWDDPAIMDGSQAMVPWPGANQQFGDASMAHSGAFARPAFSATELDLPRLTNPALEGELPPEWEDLLADEFAAQRAANGRGRNSAYAPDYGNRPSQLGGYPGSDYGAGSSYNGWPSDMGASSWSSQMEYGEWGGEAAGGGMAPPPEFSQPQAGAQLPQWELPSRRGASGYPGDSFLDQPVWTVGNTAVRRPRRWLRWLLLSLLLLAVSATSVLIARPELCPIAACAQANQFVRNHVPIFSLRPQQDLLFTPTSLDLKTIADSPTSGSLEVSNPGSEPITWQGSTDLGWVTLQPTGGTLNPNASTILTVTAKPVGVNPDTYHSTVILQIGDHATSFPVTIVIAPGPQLSYSPQKLTFTACDAPKKLTVRNTGGGPLTFTAQASKSDALNVSPTKGTLEPGKSVEISVTVTCNAPIANYVVILVSNGGSANVQVQYS